MTIMDKKNMKKRQRQDEQNPCPVCLENLGDKGLILNCQGDDNCQKSVNNHIFCYDCVNRINNGIGVIKCPLCRKLTMDVMVENEYYFRKLVYIEKISTDRKNRRMVNKFTVHELRSLVEAKKLYDIYTQPRSEDKFTEMLKVCGMYNNIKNSPNLHIKFSDSDDDTEGDSEEESEDEYLSDSEDNSDDEFNSILDIINVTNNIANVINGDVRENNEREINTGNIENNNNNNNNMNEGTNLALDFFSNFHPHSELGDLIDQGRFIQDNFAIYNQN